MSLLVRPFPGLQPYEATLRAMRRFSDERGPDTPDEIWLVEHPPVYTLGLKTDPSHLLAVPDHIPVVQTDRGGQITYHGPGQLILYPLLNLRRNGLTVRQLVHGLEASVIGLLAQFGIRAAARPDAPGVYVDKGKIASVGLKVRRGASYHGIALNWQMDLTPFEYINPCGLKHQPMTQLCQLTETCPDKEAVWKIWVDKVVASLSLPAPEWRAI